MTTLQQNQDRLNPASKGDLIDPHHSADFVVDPMLTPVTTSAAPKPVLPDPNPTDNPELFDQSTRHPNDHYHPEKKLSKKKAAKKFGLGGNPSHNHANDAFSGQEKSAVERQRIRDEHLDSMQHAQAAADAAKAEDEDEDDEGSDDDHDDQSSLESQSQQKQHHGRTVHEETEKSKPKSSLTTERDVNNKTSLASQKDHHNSNKDTTDNKSSADNSKNTDSNKDAESSESSGGLLSGLATKATGMMSAVLNKVGFNKSESDASNDEVARDDDHEMAKDDASSRVKGSAPSNTTTQSSTASPPKV